jgi:hypothetical protein
MWREGESSRQGGSVNGKFPKKTGAAEPPSSYSFSFSRREIADEEENE